MNQPVVASIGTENGRPVLRVVLPDKRILYVDTNLVSFAKLAAAGVHVVNV